VYRWLEGELASAPRIVWTLLPGASRDRFRAELGVDSATWSRGRGWALWKALISRDRHVVDQVLADHARDR
jgi:hypothetical protein